MKVKQLSKQANTGVTPSVMLYNPKSAVNVGMIVRLASCFGFRQVWYTGGRVDAEVRARGRIPREERMKGYRDADIINYDYPLEQFGEAVPVAIEVRENSTPLHMFEHPENAVYVFGPEDGSIAKPVMHCCHHFVTIPTRHCLNLATAVTAVMYDRMLKGYLSGSIDMTDFTTPGEYEGRGLIENDPLDVLA
jgi:tRNA(Leu) C34 or U34 (ribose-2'-O)-methylase TrmL